MASKKPAARGSSAKKKKRKTAARAKQENREVLGLLLLAFGLILSLSLYTGTTGVFGKFITDTTGRFIGVARFFLPLIVFFYGWKFLSDKSSSRKKRRRRHNSEYIAWGCLFFASFSFFDLVGGRPVRDAPVEDLSRAGGWFGVFTGGNVEQYTGFWVEVIVTIVLFIVAAIFLTSLSVSPYAEVVSEKVVPAWGRFNEWLASFGWSGTEDDEESAGSRRKKFKPVFSDDEEEGEDEEESDEYIDLNKSDALEKIRAGSFAEQQDAPHIEIPQPVTVDSAMVSVPQPPDGSWGLPDMALLDRTEVQDVDRESVEATGRQLEYALAEHGVETRLIGVVVGPTVSRFELELGPGVKVQKVISLHKDIAYAMATPDVRILAPIPGKQAIGVEVPNVRRQIITVGDLLYSEEANAATHPLEVALGRNINGRTVMANLAEMPHLLVAGQTGSGKSSCINSVLTSILMRSTPDQVRLILIDPKRVELTQYSGLPHLLSEVVTDPKKAANALSWAVKEMERRYDLLSDFGVRDITGYNTAVDEGRIDPKMGADGELVEASKISYVVVVLDELADLMMVAARDVEESICRIAQKARAVGIHLIIATQRPSTNVITGLIKANVPARLAFAVSSLTDSRVILDQPGAERLVGRGDALLNDGRTSSPTRFQGAWVTEEEVSDIVRHWADQSSEIVYDSRVVGEEATQGSLFSDPGIPGGSSGDEGDDELLIKAVDLVVRSQLGSTSMLQRKLRIGFARAGRIMDLLEERKIVGPASGSKAREVLMTKDDLEAGRWPVSTVTPADSTSSPARRVVSPTAQPEVSEPKPRRRTIAEIPNPEPVRARKRFVKPETDTAVSESDDMDLEPDPELGILYKASNSAESAGETEPVVYLDEGDDDLLFDDLEGEDDPALAPPPDYNRG